MSEYSLSHERVAELIEGRRPPESPRPDPNEPPELYRQRAVPFWPRTAKGLDYAIDKDTLKEMAAALGDHYPWVARFAQLKRLVDGLDTWSLRCGDDGRNRYPVMPYVTKTGRNAPSSTEFIFGMTAGLRP